MGNSTFESILSWLHKYSIFIILISILAVYVDIKIELQTLKTIQKKINELEYRASSQHDILYDIKEDVKAIRKEVDPLRKAMLRARYNIYP